MCEKFDQVAPRVQQDKNSPTCLVIQMQKSWLDISGLVTDKAIQNYSLYAVCFLLLHPRL